jgi:hypothetical protein
MGLLFLFLNLIGQTTQRPLQLFKKKHIICSFLFYPKNYFILLAKQEA